MSFRRKFFHHQCWWHSNIDAPYAAKIERNSLILQLRKYFMKNYLSFEIQLVRLKRILPVIIELFYQFIVTKNWSPAQINSFTTGSKMSVDLISFKVSVARTIMCPTRPVCQIWHKRSKLRSDHVVTLTGVFTVLTMVISFIKKNIFCNEFWKSYHRYEFEFKDSGFFGNYHVKLPCLRVNMTLKVSLTPSVPHVPF